MTKKEFLKALENELINLKFQDLTSILEYYDELIEDQIESGIKEKEIINKLSIYDIIKEIRVHKKINDAVAKPTISNSIKALIAFLGILSFPMLLIFGILIISLLIAICAIIFSLVITIGALLISSIVCLTVFIFAAILGYLPISTSFLGIGISLILTGTFAILTKWTFNISKDMILWVVNIIKTKFIKRKGGMSYE